LTSDLATKVKGQKYNGATKGPLWNILIFTWSKSDHFWEWTRPTEGQTHRRRDTPTAHMCRIQKPGAGKHYIHLYSPYNGSTAEKYIIKKLNYLTKVG